MQVVDFKGTKISHLALGTVQLGLDYGIANKDGKPNIKEACELLSSVIDRGVNCFDTAIAYGDSEKILGECIKKDVLIVTKISSNEFENLESEVKSSLDRLSKKQLFGLLLHDNSILNNWSQKESKKIDNLKEMGYIKHFGISIYNEVEFNRALEIDDIELIQVPSNMLDNRLVKNRWIQRAKEKNKLLFIRSVYLQGLFFLGSKNLPEYLKDAKEFLEELEDIAKKLNLELSQLALSYIKSVADGAIILFGAENKRQAIENIELFEKLPILSDEVVSDIILLANSVDETIYNPSLWRKD